MRNFLVVSLSILTCAATTFLACGSDESEFNDPGAGDGGPSSSGGFGDACLTFGGCGDGAPTPGSDGGVPCSGLACNIATCAPGQETTLTGKVYDPAGKVPLFNVLVYVADEKRTPLAPITLGLGEKCDRCDGETTGILTTQHNPPRRIYTLTDATGSFKLPNVPSDIDITLVMQIGKWRRKVTIPKVAPCQTRTIDDRELTRLPRNHVEGDIPRIALTTGGSDPMECLFRKIGLDVSEFGTAGDNDARVHLYEGGSTRYDPATTPAPIPPDEVATSSFQAGRSFAKATDLWNDVAKLKAYDIVVLSCEGSDTGPNQASKPVSARQALYNYARDGGRIFSSHYHHYWFSNSPVPEVRNLATWTNDFTCENCFCAGTGPIDDPSDPVTPTCSIVREPEATIATQGSVNVSFPKGKAMKDWLAATNSLTNDTLEIREMRHNVDKPTPNPAGGDPLLLSWITTQNPAANNRIAHEYVTFNTPVGASDAEICGRVVYSDLHVVPSKQPGGDQTNKPFPSGCNTAELTAQQKALEFMLFDLSSCIQNDAKPPPGPR